MDVANFSATFNLADSGLVETIRSELVKGENDRKTMNAEPYKLNVHGASLL
jgi:hypothetical protein